jgi:lipopolysaccharide export system protein LptA
MTRISYCVMRIACFRRTQTPTGAVAQTGTVLLAVAVAMLLLGSAPTASAQDQQKFVVMSADTTRWTADDKVTATGNVKAVYQDYTVTADSLDADLQANTAVFTGHVKLVTKQATVEGENLSMNLKTREWKLDNASSRINPITLQDPQTKGGGSPTIIHSVALSGTSDQQVAVSEGTLTTCDKEHPHYFFSAKDLEVYPDNKIVAHNVSMVGLDKKLLGLKTLLIPIRGLGQNVIPQIGSSAEEGAFIKAAYAYTATQKSTGILKLDLMQRRGIGAGIEQTLKTSLGTSQASLYYLADQQLGGSNITGSLRHQQKLGALDLNLTGNYRTHSYLYYPSTTSQDWQAVLSHVTSKANTALTLRNFSTLGLGSNVTSSSSLRHTQQFNSKLNGVVSLDMRSYNSTGMPAADRELDSSIELRQRDEKYDLSLIASKRFDLDAEQFTGDNFYSNLDRLPELTISTDSYRLGEKSFLGLPSRLSLSAGRYHEMPSGVSSNRMLLQWDLLGKNIDLSDKNELNLTGSFRQAYYAKDMMQYVFRGGAILTTRYSDYLKSRVSYYYQRPEGFSPFRFDYTGKYNYLRAVTDYQDSDKLKWTLSSGYNFSQTGFPWQDVTFRLTTHPKPSYAFSLSTGYDVNRSKWRTLISQVRVVRGDRVGLELGARYDIETGKIGLARSRFDFQLGKKWRVEGITSWNGITKKFDYKAFRLTRDMHCWEASLVYNDETGFRENKGISLEFRIKAFPTADRFGIGQYGQAVDTSMGEYYY